MHSSSYSNAQLRSDIRQGAQENLMKARDARVALTNEANCCFSCTFIINRPCLSDTWWNSHAEGE